MRSEEQDDVRVPETWRRRIDFVMNMVGMCIGLGNMWRFPYLCYKNGGGVFLIAYLILVVVFVVPVIILEVAVGQYTRSSSVAAWKLVPILQGIGYAGYVILIYSDIYYPVIMAWALRWLVAGISGGMPWANCNNTWNSETCIPLISDQSNGSVIKRINDTSHNNGSSRYSSVEEFWRENVISISSGIEDIGELNTGLALSLLAVWILTYFSIWKGIGWTSKVVYVTATMPVVMIIVVFIRGVTLDGAVNGITQYLNPNISKLGNFEVWLDAANQVTFSFILGYGCHVTLSSHNRFNHNLIRDAIISCCANACASFLAGFAIFSVLGHLAEVKNTNITKVVESGPGLVFIAYPTALSFLPLPNFWIVLFFTTVIFLGLDSLFVIQDGVLECTKDIVPSLFRHKWSHEIGHGVLSIAFFLLGLFMVTEGGMYILHIASTYAASGWCTYCIIFFEVIAIGWIYGASKMCDHIHDMVKWKVPRIWLTICWKLIVPALTFVLLSVSLWQMEPLKYDRTHYYPSWINVIAWIWTFTSVICIPAFAFYSVWKSDGDNLVQKIRNSTKPSQKFHSLSKRTDLQLETPFIEHGASDYRTQQTST